MFSIENHNKNANLFDYETQNLCKFSSCAVKGKGAW